MQRKKMGLQRSATMSALPQKRPSAKASKTATKPKKLNRSKIVAVGKMKKSQRKGRGNVKAKAKKSTRKDGEATTDDVVEEGESDDEVDDDESEDEEDEDDEDEEDEDEEDESPATDGAKPKV